MQAHLSLHDDALEWQAVSLRWQILLKVKMLIFLNDLEVQGATVLDFISYILSDIFLSCRYKRLFWKCHVDSEEGARAADRTAPRFCASVIILFISLAAPCEDTVRNQLHTSSVSNSGLSRGNSSDR